MTGLKANLQILPWYEFSYHVVRNGQSEHPKIKCIILIKAAQKNKQKYVMYKNFTHPLFIFSLLNILLLCYNDCQIWIRLIVHVF